MFCGDSKDSYLPSTHISTPSKVMDHRISIQRSLFIGRGIVTACHRKSGRNCVDLHISDAPTKHSCWVWKKRKEQWGDDADAFAAEE